MVRRDMLRSQIASFKIPAGAVGRPGVRIDSRRLRVRVPQRLRDEGDHYRNISVEKFASAINGFEARSEIASGDLAQCPLYGFSEPTVHIRLLNELGFGRQRPGIEGDTARSDKKDRRRPPLADVVCQR